MIASTTRRSASGVDSRFIRSSRRASGLTSGLGRLSPWTFRSFEGFAGSTFLVDTDAQLHVTEYLRKSRAEHRVWIQVPDVEQRRDWTSGWIPEG